MTDSARQAKTNGNIENFSTSILGEPPGNFHRNTACNSFLTTKPNYTVSIPIESTQQAEHNKKSKYSKIHSSGATGQFSWKSTLNINFLISQPISSNSLLIDSARPEEECENIKITSNLVLGKQPGNFQAQDTPNINFSTVQPIFAR
jgi:hypothetical protein